MTHIQHLLAASDAKVTGIQDAKPAAFGLSRIGGLTGKLIAAGQAIAGDGSRFTHAWVILDDERVIEAEPGGARIVPIAKYLGHEEIVICDRPVQEMLARQNERAPKGLTDVAAYSDYVENLFRRNIVETAKAFEHAPYGWFQYLFIGLKTLGVKGDWLKKLIGNKRVICSQLVSRVYQLGGGIELFTDGRWEGEVTPGDLDWYRQGN